MSLNHKLATLLELYYAYPKDQKNIVVQKIKEINKGPVLYHRADVTKALSDFHNQHLYLIDPDPDKPNKRDTKLEQANLLCVRARGDQIQILSFWCQNSDQQSSSSIREHFAHLYIKAMNEALAHLKRTEGTILSLDLRGNGGGGDPEMELALFPFIEKGEYIYDYQFKLLTSPHFWPKLLSQLMGLLHLKKMLKDRWDQRRKYFFSLNENLWSEEILKELKQIKERVSTMKIELHVLVDSQTGSASELFAAILKDLGRAKLKGERTKGSAGAPNHYTLDRPRGFEIAIPAVRVWRINGKPIEGIGLTP